MEFGCCVKNSGETENLRKLYQFLRSVSDSNRLKIVCLLRSGPKCVCEIVAALRISDKLASHHLGRLKKAGILNDKRQGNFVFYSLDKSVIISYKKILNEIIK